MKNSLNLMMHQSVFPPKKPARPPKIIARARETALAMKPMVREMRLPALEEVDDSAEQVAAQIVCPKQINRIFTVFCTKQMNVSFE